MNKSPSRSWQIVVLVLVVTGLIALGLSGLMNPVLRAATNPLILIQRWVSTRYIALYDFFKTPKDVTSLRQRNAELEAEIALLQTQIIDLQQQLSEAQVLYALLDFARSRPENTYIASSIIGRDPSPFLQYVIIDHGSDDGVLQGMPVVNQNGLVGRVDAVTANASRVQLISDPASSINVHLRNASVDAVLLGSVTGDIGLEMIPNDITLAPGDLILTSGLGGGYPAEVVVGQILGIRRRENDLFQSASVQPAVDFSTLQAVLVITNFKPVDILPLIPTPAP
jgi:rod shape-determining protein MreC